MQYNGEQLLFGQIGNGFVLLSFVAALLASVSYFFAARDNEESASWKKIGRIAYWLHSLGVVGIIVTLFMMIYQHRYEYYYVWFHSSNDLEIKYIFSCFWEGQEGSFLLWTFWHVVLGNILVWKSKTWEAPVMAVVSFVQFFLASMLLGINIGDYHVGSNPFTVLLREHPDYLNLPLFADPDYLFNPNFDGRGLNLLLRNYWMTIHPPTLFLGFASTVVPFAYAIAGLWKKRYNEWQKPALPWAFFGVMVLGTGVLMGGAWAYEALSFGGFWAWDPVENASLVPWLTLVGGAHVMLINKNKGTSLGATFFMVLLTFILILYSTFLTRSGILGDSSVHAFTDLGMQQQLLLFILAFIFVCVVCLIEVRWLKVSYFALLAVLIILLFAVNNGLVHKIALSVFLISSCSIYFVESFKKFKSNDEEEAIWSREFWMFVGALVLLISSFQIMYTTSIPVWNKLFGLKMAPPADVFKHYHPPQIAFAIIICLLIAAGQFFKYKNTDIKEWFKKVAISLFTSLILAVVFAIGLGMSNGFYITMLFATLFAAIANASYFITVLKGKISKAGASIAHVGFALLLTGALISTTNRKIISVNNSGTNIENLDKSISNSKNILLIKGDTLEMGEYFVTYIGKRKGTENHNKSNIYFDVNYLNKDKEGKLAYQFTLSPFVQQNPRMGNSPEPGTQHFLTEDIYTHIVSFDVTGLNEQEPVSKLEYTEPEIKKLAKGEEFTTSNSIVLFESLSMDVDKAKYGLGDKDIAVSAKLKVTDEQGKVTEIEPLFIVKNSLIQPVEAGVESLGLKINFVNIHPDENTFEFSVQEKTSNVKDFIVMEAIVFPYINVLWLGCIIMIIGTLIALRQRIKLFN